MFSASVHATGVTEATSVSPPLRKRKKKKAAHRVVGGFRKDLSFEKP
jgi:hypothetical protein